MVTLQQYIWEFYLPSPENARDGLFLTDGVTEANRFLPDYNVHNPCDFLQKKVPCHGPAVRNHANEPPANDPFEWSIDELVGIRFRIITITVELEGNFVQVPPNPCSTGRAP